MFVKVEPSGCCERKGMVQIRFCMYLDQGDFGYHIHHVKIPVIPEGGYPGEVDAMGIPVDAKDYDTWVKSLPTVWQVNPFHNHFILAEPDITDIEILDIGEVYLKEAYADWSSDKKPNPKNKPHIPPVITSARIEACEVKVQHLRDIVLERQI